MAKLVQRISFGDGAESAFTKCDQYQLTADQLLQFQSSVVCLHRLNDLAMTALFCTIS